MSRCRYVLGVNCAHDAAACVLRNGRIAVAIAEERLSRIKHHEGFPALAIAYCMAEMGLDHLDRFDAIVVNEYPSTDHTRRFREQGYTGTLVTNPSHHHLHALYALAASGRRDASILILDGSGYSYGEYERRGSILLGPPPPSLEMEEAESSFIATDGELAVVHKRWGLWVTSKPYYRFPSLGHLFSMASQYIFGHWHHAGKTMGLAPYGDERAFAEPMVTLADEGIDVHTDWIVALPPRSSRPADEDPACLGLAARVQAEVERGILHLADLLVQRTGVRDLCLSGGVALNSVANGLIARRPMCASLFVTPAASDAGVAVGAAVFAHQLTTGSTPVWTSYRDFHGRRYGDADVVAALAEHAGLVDAEYSEDGPAQAARDLAAGRVVGWFEGGSELGPRALGHRSILADPARPAMKELLNARVKFREGFRPYAASVLAEDVDTFFVDAPIDHFMLTVVDVRDEAQEALASITHVDGTCRIQVVDEGDPSSFRRLLEELRGLTGRGVVLNTSFNIRGEPIVETPHDAVRCFLTSNIDVLYLGGRRITRPSAALIAEAPACVVPVPLGVRRLHSATEWDGAGWTDAAISAETRTGYRVPLDPDEARALGAVDGRTTVAALQHDGTTGMTLRRLVERGLVALRNSGHPTAVGRREMSSPLG